MWRHFLSGDGGQDFVEYTLLLGFIVVVCAAMVMATGVQINGLWSTVNSRLNAANSGG